ncbi:vomeronasal type-1 receptor 4-like [Acomys russatus]|uniref:vomeronasal type-1 receptor 4-like n=1 Tax=Acomys russatus TaxID=60746 RepID=UPI0021E23A0A|nr:vomeronasal type-1 receptor 4-like [Acomys russatus]
MCSTQDLDGMSWTDLAVGIFFLLQTSLGMLGNSALLCCFMVADLAGIRAKPTDLIVKHLTWANIMVLCRGVLQTTAAFHQTFYLEKVSCKLALYFHRVARGVSIGSMSLLSVIQAITISPNNSMWAQLKIIAPRIIGPYLGLCWATQLLVYIFIPVYTTDIWGGINVTGIEDYGYCAVVNPERRVTTLIAILLTSRDVIFLVLMMCASASMVLVLLKHMQRVRHIHRSLSPRSSPETKATQSILTLVSSFVLFYITSTVFTSHMAALDVKFPWLVSANVAMTACFPACCPFLLLRQHTSVFRLCCTCSYQTTHRARVVREL